MTLLYQHPRFLRHETGNHPENAGRLRAIAEELTRTGLDDRCGTNPWRPATAEQLGRVHDPDYVERVRHFAATGGGAIEQDTIVSPESYDAAVLAAGAACDAVDRVMGGEDRTALCLHRPPGHHALEHDAMGFCLFNHVAIAARQATDHWGLDRVLIVDWDVHHGNGTQDAFWDDGRVGFYSIHRYPFYPGTGAAAETGTGAGSGMTRNVPIEWGTPRETYLRRFAESLEDFADTVRPQIVLVSAGFDAHHADPIGSLGLRSEDFAELTRVVLRIADAHASGRLVSLLEGGYDPQALAESSREHLQQLLRHDQ